MAASSELRSLTVMDRNVGDRESTEPVRAGQGVELTIRLTDEQVAQIAARAAALVPAATPASPWLNVAEAAERLRCRKDRIYDLIALGRLHPLRDGRRVLLRRDDLDAYLDGRSS